MTPFEALTTPLTVDQVRLSIYSVIAQLGVDTTAWKPGAVVRTMIAAVAIVVAALSQLTSAAARSGFLEYSTGVWLTLLAKNLYGVDRITATFGTGTALASNASGGIYVLSDGELQVVNQRTGAVYVNVGALTIPGVSANIPVTLIAVEAGSGSTALATDVLTVATPLDGVTVVLTSSIVGLDDELDTKLQQRCRDKLGSLSPNGPGDAYSFVAKSAVRADGSPIGVTRVRVFANGDGTIDVYCTNVNGTLDSSDLSAINTAIQTKCTPLGVTVTTHAAVPQPVAVLATVYMYRSGLTDDAVIAAVEAELDDFFDAQPIGGNLGFIHREALIAAIGRVSTQLPIFRVGLAIPVNDFAIASTEVATPGGYAIAVVQVATPAGV